MLLLLLVSCGKDPVNNSEATKAPASTVDPVAVIYPGCAKIEGCNTSCKEANVDCVPKCMDDPKYHFRRGHCPDICESRYRDCITARCDEVCKDYDDVWNCTKGCRSL
jgi:hypothetical protein